MKKLLSMAAAATLLAGAAFAQGPSTLNADKLFVKPNATFPGAGAGNGPFTTNNDDTCDIAVTPAATLLLPYFEVDLVSDATVARNTVFSITNTSRMPQIAHVTIWTDRSFPVIDFNLFLTGYDVVPVSLYDIIQRGQIPPTSAGVTPGSRSAANSANGQWAAGQVAACTGLPGAIPESLRSAIASGLSTGTYLNPATGTTINGVGSNHPNVAIGYVTVDVSSQCSTTLPTSAGYYTNEILWSNVFIGEYVRVNPTATTGNYAGAESMVHIRAIPDGSAAADRATASAMTTNLPYTFYSRYTDQTNNLTRRFDRRQPLPALFAARYIESSIFQTRFAIWREGQVMGAANETSAVNSLVAPTNENIPIVEIVRFDESENPTVTTATGCQISPCPPNVTLTSREARAWGTTETSFFPPDSTATADAGGWMYLNLNNNFTGYGGARATGGTHAGVSQNWVIVQMTAEGRFGADFSAAYLGNGCSANPGVTTTTAVNPIGPAPDVTP